MVAAGKIAEFPPEVVLCREGAIEKTFYILLDGKVKVTKVINDEEQRHLSDLHPGDFFGEMAIIHDAPRNATVVTVTACTVLEFHKDDFDSLVRQNSSISVAMVREVSRRLRENNDLAVDALRIKASELATAYQQLAEYEHARSEFLTTIAHELRTPLTVANGFLQMLRYQSHDDLMMHSALESMERNLRDITGLVNDILYLQEVDIILPEFQPVEIGKLVEKVVEQQRQSAQHNRIALQIVNRGEGLFMQVDERSLSRAIAAIVGNAEKFSPMGGDIHVGVGQSEDQIYIRIEDHGVGIPPEAISKIFDRFFHIEAVGEHLFRGIGLGLSIAKQVIELHQGTIRVESELGKGSIFEVWLPKG